MPKPIPEAKSSRPRLPEIDFFRGIAILMMAVFHFVWDLDYFNAIGANLHPGFWSIFQKLTGGLFIFLVGVSLTLSYSRSKEKYPVKFIARGSRIFCYGLMITVLSYFFAKQSLVFFGILHFIGISIILVTPFIWFSWLNLFLGIAALAIGAYLQRFIFSFPWLVWLGFRHPVNTLDLYTVLPWIGLVFFGLFAGNMLYPKGRPRIRISFPKISKPVQFLGRNSLLIYFIHLPVMFAIAFVISLIV